MNFIAGPFFFVRSQVNRKGSDFCHLERGRQAESRDLYVMKTYSVYLITNQTHSVLYIGMSSNIDARLWQHFYGFYPNSFSAKYAAYKLVYVEQTTDVHVAVNRERQLKRWGRSKKIRLIERQNPYWKDLSNRGISTSALKGPPVDTTRVLSTVR